MTISHDTQSYFQANAERVQRSVLASRDQAFKDLLVSFMTINRYRDLLFDPQVDLRTDISTDFINRVMIPDFSSVILKLRDYRGGDRKGVQEAYKYMDSALRDLYKANNEKWPINAAMDCRNKLHNAYQHLEHLGSHLASL